MEITQLISYVVGLGLLMLCSAFFSGSETALSALTRTQVQRMRREKTGGGAAVVRFLDEPRRLFITVLFGNTLVNMAFISILGALIYDTVFQGRNPGAAYLTAILIETAILLLFGEITPKSLAIRNPERFSLLTAPFLWTFSRFIFPFRRILRYLTDLLLPLLGVRSMIDARPVTSEEIRETVRATAEGGAIDEQEGEVLSNVFELQDTKVREILVPRTKMVGVEVSTPIREAFETAMQRGHSRLPVFRAHLDNICGIFYVKDLPRWRNVNVEVLGHGRFEDLTLDDFLSHQELLGALNPGQEYTLIRPPFFVFRTQNIGTLLRDMTRNKQQMAVILDEFGGVEGLVTSEDIIEEVIGEIRDEYDALPEQDVIREEGHAERYRVPGAMSLRALNRRLALKLDVAIADTVSGYITHLSGTIPKAGDMIRDEPQGLVFEVLKMAGTRIDLLRLLDKRRASGKPFPALLVFLALMPWLGMAGAGPSAAAAGDAPSLTFLAPFLILLVFSLAMMAFFAGSETAVVSASAVRIEILAQQNDRRALFIKTLMGDSDRMLGTVLVGTNLMGTAAGAAGLQLTRMLLPHHERFQELANTLVMTLVILLFCEILPKTVFRARADSLALRSAGMLRISAALLRPVVVFFTMISQKVVRFAGAEDKAERSRIMREELKLLAEMGEEEGTLRKDQIRMVHGILDLDERAIGKIMTPLVDMVALPEKTPVEVFLRQAADTGFSRIPIYKDRVDNIVGVVNVLDVLYTEELPDTIAPFIRRDIRHEPESRRILPLLKELSRSRSPMVFVVDEYGGVVGLVTIEDLVEAVMGDIWDEKDREQTEVVKRISERVLDCEGKAEIQLLNLDFGLTLPEGEYNTLAGYIIEKLQRIPKKGESLVEAGIKFLVLDADAKSVRRIRIIIK
jgi:CBS domain containing-hemolysin-like protein